jgi:fermentation-respiration switch protein FrsA (DUF1100 family)
MQYFFISFFALALLYVSAIFIMQSFQQRLIFQGKPSAPETRYQFEHPHQEICLSYSDGTSVHGLYFQVAHSKGVVLYFHGNSKNLERWGKEYATFVERSYDVLLIDYRGYGKSKGISSEENLYKDARKAYEWLTQKYPASNIVLYGRSLGAAVASKLATEVPAKLLIMETPFSSIAGVFGARLLLTDFPLKLCYQLSNAKNVPQVPYPVHIFHGTKDKVVPYREAIRLKQVLQAKDSFTIIEGGTHRNITSFGVYQKKLTELLF